MPTSRFTPDTGFPSTSTCPADGLTKPAMIHSRLDLPQPDGPTNDTNSPARTCKDTSRNAVKACRPPSLTNRWVTPASSTAHPCPGEPHETTRSESTSDCVLTPAPSTRSTVCLPGHVGHLIDYNR